MRAYQLGDAAPSDVRSWQMCRDDEGRAHVFPDFGPRHLLAGNCWCHPTVDYQDCDQPMTHNVAN